ncbi:MAG: hypothetical protein V4501_01110 [Pseudomonadota bacterium]
MLQKKFFVTVVLITIFLELFTKAYAADEDKFRYPIYVGVMAGYGSTTWSVLVPSKHKASSALALSTPTSVTEGGATGGVFAGYEIIPQFAFEMNYTKYPQAVLHFSKKSLFFFRNNHKTQFTTNTESVGLLGKFMVIIPRTTVRAFSSVGIAGVHRADILTNQWRPSPTFNVGFNYNFTPHVMTEFAVNYTGGYGQSELTPTDDYIPFLYSVYLRLGYRF